MCSSRHASWRISRKIFAYFRRLLPSLFFRIVQSIAGYRKFYRTCVKTPCLHAVPLPLDRRTVSWKQNYRNWSNKLDRVNSLSLASSLFQVSMLCPTKSNSGNSYETWPMVEIYWQISILSALRLPPSFFSRPIQAHVRDLARRQQLTTSNAPLLLFILSQFSDVVKSKMDCGEDIRCI